MLIIIIPIDIENYSHYIYPIKGEEYEKHYFFSDYYICFDF